MSVCHNAKLRKNSTDPCPLQSRITFYKIFIQFLCFKILSDIFITLFLSQYRCQDHRKLSQILLLSQFMHLNQDVLLDCKYDFLRPSFSQHPVILSLKQKMHLFSYRNSNRTAVLSKRLQQVLFHNSAFIGNFEIFRSQVS